MNNEKTNGKSVWLSNTVLGEGRELAEFGDEASWNSIFGRIIEIVYEYRKKESKVNSDFFADINKILEGKK